ncbi:MAG TPA: hypothetical protein DD632_01185 [Oribacterium sp.]|nr:hypothetical protein [Oribacterium sp.]HCS67853.1 hypothetical protein [Oribacterium sp.]
MHRHFVGLPFKRRQTLTEMCWRYCFIECIMRQWFPGITAFSVEQGSIAWRDVLSRGKVRKRFFETAIVYQSTSQMGTDGCSTPGKENYAV